MASKHLSGASKRKLKQERDKQVSKLPKIATFFKNAENVNVVGVNAATPESDVAECSGGAAACASGTAADGAVNVDKRKRYSDGDGDDHGDETDDAGASGYQTQYQSQDTDHSDNYILEQLASKQHPTDKGHFPEFSEISVPLTVQEKKFIVLHGPCQPKGPFPRDPQQKGRHFSEAHYIHTSKAGVFIPRSWLCYSKELDVAYCEPCWLFSNLKARASGWVKGIRDWGHLSNRITEHEDSKDHMECCVVYYHWRLNKTLTEETEEMIRKKANYWRQVLERVINVTLMLAMSNLPFRGHRENENSSNKGNFLSVIDLIAKYDPVLDKLISTPNAKVTYLSNKIQNELIVLLSDCVRKQITQDINNSQFFSVIMDTTQDIGKVDQLSQVFRYVTIELGENGKPNALKINESFMGFVEVEDQTAGGLEESILASIMQNSLDLSKLRGQGYDGAATMSGTYSGVQARIKAKQEKAVYVHCAAHNLNLVLNDAMSAVKEVRNFFGLVEKIYVFFGHSIKRWKMLSSLNSSLKLTLKRLCPTRWSSRHDTLLAIRHRYVDIMKALSKIILLSKKPDEISEAVALKHQLEKFEFVFLVVMITDILKSVHCVSQMMQSPDEDLSNAVNLLKIALNDLEKDRDQFQSFYDSAEQLAKSWGTTAKFDEEIRIRKVPRFHDELCEDQRLTSAEQRFRVEVFNATFDVAITQLQQRFLALKEVVETFSAILPSTLVKSTDQELYDAGETLYNHYENDLSPSFPAQLVSFRSCLRSEIAKKKTVKEIAELLIVENSALSTSLPDVCTAFLLFLTIPVTVATAERSFSKLKLIKNYLRSAISQDRLSGLAVLSVENARARKLDIAKVIDVFAEAKARKKDLK